MSRKGLGKIRRLFHRRRCVSQLLLTSTQSLNFLASVQIIASEPLSPHASAESLSRALVTVHSATPFFESIWKASHLADAQLQYVHTGSEGASRLADQVACRVQTRQSSGHRDVLSWVPLKGHLHHDGYWELPVSDVMINGESLGVTTRAALFDPCVMGHLHRTQSPSLANDSLALQCI